VYRVPTVRLASLCLAALLVLLAGCAGLAPSAGSGDPTATETPTRTPVDTVERAPYPDPPDDLTNSSARAVVRAYEAARLQNALRNTTTVTSFDLGYIYPDNVTVLNGTDAGLYVRYDGSYSYGTPDSHADGVPIESTYLVNETAVTYLGPEDLPYP